MTWALSLTTSVIFANLYSSSLILSLLTESEGVGPNDLIIICRGFKLLALGLHLANKHVSFKLYRLLKTLNQLSAFKN